jgi:hypothetical protein
MLPQNMDLPLRMNDRIGVLSILFGYPEGSHPESWDAVLSNCHTV